MSGLGAEALRAIVLACAPLVSPETALKLVMTESGGNPWAIGVNGPYVVRPQPQTADQALATARRLLEMPGVKSIDIGLAMINSQNLPRFRLSLEQAFDPCINLAAMQSHLATSYARGIAEHGAEQRALQQALSEYNTGHRTRGIHNGYVRKVYVQPIR